MSTKKPAIVFAIMFCLFAIAWALMPRPTDPYQAMLASIDRIPLEGGMTATGFFAIMFFLFWVIPDSDNDEKP